MSTQESEPERSDEQQRPPEDLHGHAAEHAMRRLSRRSFLQAGAAVVAVYAGWRWLITRRTDAGVVWPLRRGLEINEELSRDYFRPGRLAETFPNSVAGEPRENGTYGLNGVVDPKTWRLTVEGAYEQEEPLHLTLAAIQALPPVNEMVTELKCIEGWSQVVNWGGVRLADFIARYPPPTVSGDPPDVLRRPDDLYPYVYLATPDGGYYVGLDMASALHPQTLLCDAMNGAPLTAEHGAPLRLVIPVKYGIKNIKRIGTIRYAADRPADYWAERGYDWYAGH